MITLIPAGTFAGLANLTELCGGAADVVMTECLAACLRATWSRRCRAGCWLEWRGWPCCLLFEAHFACDRARSAFGHNPFTVLPDDLFNTSLPSLKYVFAALW